MDEDGFAFRKVEDSETPEENTQDGDYKDESYSCYSQIFSQFLPLWMALN
jgi:hypothetical protein